MELALPLLALLGGATGTASEALDLRACLRLTLEQSPAILRSRLAVEEARAGARAALTPFDSALSVTLDGSYGQTPTPDLAIEQGREATVGGALSYAQRFAFGTQLSASVEHRYRDSVVLGSPLNPRDRTDLRLGIVQPILRGAGEAVNHAALRAAELLAQAAAEDHRRLVDLTLAQVAQAYWELVRAEEELKVRGQSVARASRLSELAEEMNRRGMLAPVASLEARSALELRRVRQSAALRSRLAAASELSAAILGRAAPPLAASEPLPAVTALSARPAPGPRADVRAAELRKEALAALAIQAGEAERVRLDLGLSGVLSGLGGSVDAALCASLPPGGAQPAACALGGPFTADASGLRTLGRFFAAGLTATLELPVVRAGAQGLAARALLAVSRAEAAWEESERSSAIERARWLALATQDRLRFQEAETARATARELIELEDKKWKSGSASTFDVLRIQDALTETELSVVEAQAAVAISDIRLHLAQGNVAEWLPIDPHNSPAFQGIDDRP